MKTVYFYHYPPCIHSMYRPLLDHPPAGYRFIREQGRITEPLHALNRGAVARLNVKIVKRLVSTTIIKDHLYRIKRIPEADLIYSAGHLVLRRSPWVLALPELITSLTGYDERRFIDRIPYMRTVLSRPECRHLLPNSQAIKDQVSYWFNDRGIDQKTSVVYNAIDTSPIDRLRRKHRDLKKERGVTTFIFVGSTNTAGEEPFIFKGGTIAFRMFKEMAKHRDDLRLIIVSDLDEQTRREAARMPNVTHLAPMPQQELFKQYLRADYYLSPSFGIPIMAGLEAMAFWLPIISLRTYYNPEYISDGKDGILLDPPKNVHFMRRGHLPAFDGWGPNHYRFLEELKQVDGNYIESAARQLLRRLENASHRRMAMNAYRQVHTGKFSIAHRNRQLKRIFDEATA